MVRRKIKLQVNKIERRIILVALNDFRNKLIEQGKYTDCIDELIIKLNK